MPRIVCIFALAFFSTVVNASYSSYSSGNDDSYLIRPQFISESVHLKEVPTKVVKITRTVAVKIPVPYPVKVPVHIPVPVPVNYPIKVPVPQIVKVPHHIPVEIKQSVPVELPQEVPVYVSKPIPWPQPIIVPRPVAIDKPVLYPVPKPYPYQSADLASKHASVSSQNYSDESADSGSHLDEPSVDYSEDEKHYEAYEESRKNSRSAVEPRYLQQSRYNYTLTHSN